MRLLQFLETIRIGEPQTGLLYRWVEPRKVVSNMKTDSMYPGKWKHNIPGVGQVSGISLGYDPHRWNREDVTVQFVLNRGKLNAKKLVDIPGQEVYNYSTATMNKFGDAGFTDDYEKAILDPKAEPDEAFYVGIIRPLSAALEMIQVKSYASPQLKKVVQAYAEMHGIKVEWDFIESMNEAQVPHPLINRRMVGYLRTLRSQTRRGECYAPGTAGCSQSSEFLEARFGWPRHCGTYLSKALEPVGDHCWNFLEDGSIIDITADQFGEAGYMGIKIVRPDDPEYYRYRTSHEEDYHPGGEHPEVGQPNLPEDPLYTGDDDWTHTYQSRNERGDNWWTKKKYMKPVFPEDWQQRILDDPFRHWGNPKHFKKMWADTQRHAKMFKKNWAEWDEEVLRGKTLESMHEAEGHPDYEAEGPFHDHELPGEYDAPAFQYTRQAQKMNIAGGGFSLLLRGENIVEINQISSEREGGGTAMMDMLTKLADKMNIILTLRPEPYDTGSGRSMPLRTLRDWYVKYGFESTGHHNQMARLPDSSGGMHEVWKIHRKNNTFIVVDGEMGSGWDEVGEENLMERFAQADVENLFWFWAHPQSGEIYHIDGTHTTTAVEPGSPVGLNADDYGGYDNIDIDDKRIFVDAFKKGWVRSGYMDDHPAHGTDLGLHGANREIVLETLKMLLEKGLEVASVGLRGEFDNFEYDGTPEDLGAL